jgi:hypothetical protein
MFTVLRMPACRCMQKGIETRAPKVSTTKKGSRLLQVLAPRQSWLTSLFATCVIMGSNPCDVISICTRCKQVLEYCSWPGDPLMCSEHPSKFYGSCVSKKNTQNRQYHAAIAIFATLSNSELAVPGWDRVPATQCLGCAPDQP